MTSVCDAMKIHDRLHVTSKSNAKKMKRRSYLACKALRSSAAASAAAAAAACLPLPFCFSTEALVLADGLESRPAANRGYQFGVMQTQWL